MLKLLLIALFVNACLSKFGPKKLYTLDLPTTITAVKVIGTQIFFVGPWYIAVVDNVHWKFMQKARMTPRIINKDIADPRMVGGIPTGAFKGDKKPYYWLATHGMNDTSGAIYVMQQTRDYSQWGDISVDAGWSYERVQWVDMNRDGLPDCLTARFRGGIGQMLWFQQPPGQQIWGQKIIHEGMADGNFMGFIYDKKSYILIAGNQFNTLGLYWTMNPRNNWLYSRQIRFRVVDNYGKYYDVQYVDLNKDGRRDVLTTTVQISNSRGHVLGYEIPYDIQNQVWKRRVLATGFTGDYAPGKAIAYFPSKYKRQNDRPSIFLSGAGEEKIYILSPRPRTKGWGYVKAVLQAGYGMIGIPYIVDLNDDSYPEVFIPQGSQVHVFSYDYSTSAAAPPTPKTTSETTSKRNLVYRNPFYRPTTPAPTPAIPPGALPAALPGAANGGSLLPAYPGGVGSQYPSAGSGPGSLPYPYNTGTQNQGIAGPPPGYIPQSPNSAQNPFQLASPLNPNRPNLAPQSPGFPRNPLLPPQPQGGYPNQPPSGNIISQSYPLPGGISYPQNPHPGYNPQPNVPQGQQPYQPSSQHGAGGVTNYQGQMYPPNIQNNPNAIYPNQLGILPEVNATGTGINGSQASNVTNGSEYVDPKTVVPLNLVLSVTERTFSYQSEAKDACNFEQRVLCDLDQLQDAVDIGGEVPKFEWGWFAIADRAATLENCDPGEVKYDGYICHNGMVVHLPIRQETSLPALCCSVVNWATMTKKRYSRVFEAETECQNSSRHLCSLDEMLKVWDESSYKGYQWGWFRSQKQLLRMSHNCDPEQVLWPGYQCWQNKIEVTEIINKAQEKGFCCPSSASTLLISYLTFFVLISSSWFVSL